MKPSDLEIISVDRPFTRRVRRQFSWQAGFGCRELNDWNSGDLPAPWAEGDLLYLPEGSMTERLYGMGPGYFVVTAGFSIDEGDAWYFRVTNHVDRGSDRLHVAHAQRSTWTADCDWMAEFQLVDTADPDGLARRAALLEAGWPEEESLLAKFKDPAETAAGPAIDVLNRIHAADPSVLPALIAQRVPCNDAVANDPSVQVMQAEDGTLSVGLLGIVNGLFGVDAAGSGFIAAEYDEGHLTGFAWTHPQ